MINGLKKESLRKRFHLCPKDHHYYLPFLAKPPSLYHSEALVRIVSDEPAFATKESDNSADISTTTTRVLSPFKLRDGPPR